MPNGNVIILGPTSRTNPTVGNESQFASELQNVYILPTPPKKSNPDFIPTLNTAWLSGIPAEWDSAVSGQWIAPKRAQSTNISTTSVAKLGSGAAINIGASISGIPQVAEIGDSLLGLSTQNLSSTYSTLDYGQLKPIPGVKYADFRARRVLKNSQANSGGITKIRLDGAAAATRGEGNNIKAALYAAASANPLGGAYAVFGLNGAGQTGYGWGDHGNPYALRNDFTAQSHVATKWVTRNDLTAKGDWVPTPNPLARVTPFRGDRVNVIDFGQRTLSTAYQWRPTRKKRDGTDRNKLVDKLGLTQDFIKFFFTGPKLHAGTNNPDNTETDDIIVFRAIINSLSDTFNPGWSPVTMIGRADPNYQYTGVSRDLNLDFTVYATDRDEMKPIWRKLNALAGYTAPKYNNDISLGAPWMRVTIGDLFHQQPMILTSLSYTLLDSDTTWEINIEDDKTMMQVPHKVSVSCAFSVITDFLPQRNGRFYSLAKRYTNDTNEVYGRDPIVGDDNWLSDFEGNAPGKPKLKKPKMDVSTYQDNLSGATPEQIIGPLLPPPEQ